MFDNAFDEIPDSTSNVFGINISTRLCRENLVDPKKDFGLFKDGFLAIEVTSDGSFYPEKTWPFLVAIQKDNIERRFGKFGENTIVPFFSSETIERIEVRELVEGRTCVVRLVFFFKEERSDELYILGIPLPM